MSNRECGSCRLCCTLVPVIHVSTDHILDKPAGTKCQHVSASRGCQIYEGRPDCCREWSCRWLQGRLPAGLQRPDRAGYVVDSIPDLTHLETDQGERLPVFVVQVWLSKSFDFNRFPKGLKDWVLELGNAEPRYPDGLPRWGILFRFNSKRAVIALGLEGGRMLLKDGTSQNVQSIVNAERATQAELQLIQKRPPGG
jgi:hypothetical protein